MGNKRMGPPEDIVRELQRLLSVTVFVETGTFQGETTAWAAGLFNEVVTIEASPELHARACRRFEGMPRIRLLQGDSKTELVSVLAGLAVPAIFWLDAHWSGGATAGSGNECPLLQELEAINHAKTEHIILVDDARCFLAPPPRPHQASHWPELADVVTLMARNGRRYVTMVDDVFIAVPMIIGGATMGFLQERVTADLRSEQKKGRIRQWLRRSL